MTDKDLEAIRKQLEMKRLRKQEIQFVKAKAEMDTINRETTAYYDGVYDALKAVGSLMPEGGTDNACNQGKAGGVDC